MLTKKLQPYDIFISYVVEDSIWIERFVQQLRKEGYRVWYARNELIPGSNVSALIKDGLDSSRYGIAIISKDYKSHWAYGELFALTSKSDRFIPILHNITIEEVAIDHPIITEWWAPSTSITIEILVEEIAKRISIKAHFYYWLASKLKALQEKIFILKALLIVILTIALAALLFHIYLAKRPSTEIIDTAIEQRVSSVENYTQGKFQENLIQQSWKKSDLGEINRIYHRLYKKNPVKYNQNIATFFNGLERIKTIIGLKNNGIISTTEPIEPPFGLKNYEVYIIELAEKKTTSVLRYLIINTLPILSKSTNGRVEKAGLYEVDIKYDNPLRLIEVEVYFEMNQNKKYRYINFFGAKPLETIVFEKRNGLWNALHIE